MSAAKLLKAIADEMKKAKPDERLLAKLNKDLDRALGTELQEEDQEVIRAWEKSRQGD